MITIDEELNGLVFEYAHVTDKITASGVIVTCDIVEEGIEAIDAISRSIGDSNVNQQGLIDAMSIITTKLLFELRVTRLLLRKESRFC